LPLKILLVHNYYGSSAPSGENTVYLAERDLLQRRGHQVIEFTRHSDEIRNRGFSGTVKGALATPWNPFALQKLVDLLNVEQPDVMHAHNTFPLLSPAVFRAARGMKTATVLTLHNYRIFCAAGIPMRNGTPCTECLDKNSVIPSLRYGCYRNSRLATLPLSFMIAFHRQMGTWHKDVDAFIPLTDFQRDKMADAGLPIEQMHTKPHFYPDPPEPLPWEKHNPKVVFVGRLGPEKGLHVLVDAWKEWGNGAPLLELIGDGPERMKLKAQINRSGLNDKIRFFGQLPFPQTQEKMARASLLVLPSLCYEGFPMVIREAFALGVPVAASRLGSLPHLVEDGQNGVLFEPGNTKDLLRLLQKLWRQPDKLPAMGRKARVDFEEKYTAAVNYEILMEIYQAAIEVRHKMHPKRTEGRGQRAVIREQRADDVKL
jgi:glycosyltransferase involved in cell wall biosynthesis